MKRALLARAMGLTLAICLVGILPISAASAAEDPQENAQSVDPRASSEPTDVSPSPEQKLNSETAKPTDASPSSDSDSNSEPPRGLPTGTPRATSTVATVETLQAAVAAATPAEATIITVSSSFPALSGAINLTIPDGVTITIQGEGNRATELTLAPGVTTKHLRVSGGANATILLDNLVFTGHNPLGEDGFPTTTVSGGGTSIATATTASLTINNSVLQGNSSSAIGLDPNSGAVTVSNSSILGNRATAGAALSAGAGTSPITIKNSTIGQNASNWLNYPGGAFIFQDGDRDITIDGSYIVGNNTTARGGAVALERQRGSISITKTIFANNTNDTQSSPNANETRIDGGALGATNPNGEVLDVFVDSSLFDSNIAYDEGGAVVIEGSTITSTFTNSTFYGNHAGGKQTKDGTDAGGAILFYNSGLANLQHNTFVGNYAEHGTPLLAALQQRGGAVYASAATNLNVGDNLFVGNWVTDANGDRRVGYKYSNVSWSTNSAIVKDLGGNLGIDNNTSLPAEVTTEAVYGAADPILHNDYATGVAGDPSSTVVLRSVPILPGNDGYGPGLAANLADRQASVDSRGFARPANLADSGAVEITAHRFDANGGSWNNLTTPLSFDGTEYYEAGDQVTSRYGIWYDGATTTAPETPNVAPEGKIFTGWNTKADGSGDGLYASGATQRAGDTDLVLYAQWEEIITTGTVTVCYVDEDLVELAPCTDLTGTIGEQITYPVLDIEGYTLRDDLSESSIVVLASPQVITLVYQVIPEAPPTVTPPTATVPPEVTQPEVTQPEVDQPEKVQDHDNERLPVTGSSIAIALSIGLVLLLAGSALTYWRQSRQQF